MRRGGTDIAEYAYDALGRRVYRKVINSGNLNTAAEGEFFYYDGNRLIDQLHGVAASGPQPRREIVYGLDYIDEPIAQYLTDSAGNVTQHFILQDANYNVVALTDSSGNLHQEYHYSPYGELVAAYDSSSTALTLPDQLDTILTFQGGMLDPETGNIEKRARTLLPYLGRFAQVDPNETGLVVNSASMQNGQTPIAFVAVTAGGQYLDGPNPYQFVGSNPITGRDPRGLSEFFEEEINDIAAAYYADRVATQIEVIARAQMMGRAVVGMLQAMGERIMIESIATSVWAPAPYAFATYDTYSAFRYLYDEGLSWEGAFGVAAEFYAMRGASSVQANFGIKARRGQKASAGLGINVDRSAFRFHLRSAEAGYRRPKPVNLPSWRSIDVDVEHVLSGHRRGGARVRIGDDGLPNKSLWPESMSDMQVERSIRQAYRFGKRVHTQGDRVLVVGRAHGLTIEMWINVKTRRIETAYPL